MLVRTHKSFVLVAFLTMVCLAGCSKVESKAKKVDAAKTPATAAAQASPAENGKLPKDVLVSVGDWTLTTADYDERVRNIKQAVPTFDEKNPQSKQMLIEELVRQQLMVREAREQKLGETREFAAAVKDFGDNLLVQQLVVGITKDIKVTEAEAKEYFDGHPDVFIKPVEKKVSEVVLPSEAEAKDVNAQLQLPGADFAQIAKDRSKGKTASTGGDLGYLSQAPFEQMGKVIDTLEKNSLSGIFQGPDGYYIVRVDDVRGGDKVSFEQIKDDLIKGLTGEKQQQAVLARITEASKKVKVNLNPDLLNIKTGE